MRTVIDKKRAITSYGGLLGFFLLVTVTLFLLLLKVFKQATLVYYTSYDFQRIIELSFLGLIALYVIFSGRVQVYLVNLLRMFPGWVRAALIIFFALGIISAFLSPFPKYAFLGIGLYFLIFLSLLFIATVRIRYGKIVDIGLLVSLSFSIFVYCCSTLHAYLHCDSFVKGFNFCSFPFIYMLPNFDNVRFFAQLQSWTLPLIVIPIALCRNRFQLLRIVTSLIAVYWWMLAFVSQSRATLLFVPAMVIVVLLSIYKKHALEWLKLQFIALIAGLALYVVMFYFILMNALDLFRNHLYQTLPRVMLWKMTLAKIVHYPWLGVGPQNYSAFPNRIAMHPHNSILLIAVEWGIPAAILFFSVIGFAFYKWACYTLSQVTLKEENSILLIGLTASLVAAAAHSLVSGIIVMPVSQFLFVLIVGWSLGVYGSAMGLQNVAFQKMSVACRGLIMLFSLLAMGFIVQGIFPTVLHLNWEGSKYRPGYFLPRFWLQGKLYSAL